MPFIIGVMGAGGPVEKYGDGQKRYAGIHSNFRNAMAAPAMLPEFKDNVTAVLTENYWDEQLGELSQRWGKIGAKNRELNKDDSLTKEQRQKALDAYTAEIYTPEELKILQVGKSNAEFHYLGSGKVMARIGKAFAEALRKHVDQPDAGGLKVEPLGNETSKVLRRTFSKRVVVFGIDLLATENDSQYEVTACGESFGPIPR